MIPSSLTFAPQIQEPQSIELQAAQTMELMYGLFTGEQRALLERLRRQYVLCPDSFQLDMDFRRLSFARWLVLHGHLSEEVGASSEREVT